MPGPSIQVESLVKRYGELEAVSGISFEVRPGEVFGLLGPNGAGKTSTVEILEGLRSRDGGSVRVLDLDPESQSRPLKDRIGVCLQQTNLPARIRVREALALFRSFYSRGPRPGELLDRLQLVEKRESFYQDLSGGQKQRLVLALALVNDPEVLFLDEPTAGLDPQARHEIHSLIERLRGEQRTVLLTTHYIEEAEKLCDRLAIIDRGEVIAAGTPREIRSRTLGHSVVEVVCDRSLDGELPQWEGVESAQLEEEGRRLRLVSRQAARTLVEVIQWLGSRGVELEDVNIQKPSLEDVFIELTGRSLRD